MKTKFLILSLYLLCGIQVFSQNKNDSIEEFMPGIYIESMPQFRRDKNSEEKLLNFISTHLHYPTTALNDSIEGRVIIQFWVDTLGNTDNHKVIRGVREDIDNEALRVSKLLKFEIPALQRGRPIRIMYTLPFVFDLELNKGPMPKNIVNSEDKIRKKANEFIVANSSEAFFHNLYELGIDAKIDSIIIGITYYIRVEYDKKFYYRVRNKENIITSDEIKICFDEQQNIFNHSDIPSIYKGFRLYEDAAGLSKKEIKELSDGFSKYRKMDVREIKYIYDIDTEQFYLEVIREKGFRTGILEKQQIDFQNRILIKKEEPTFLKILLNNLKELFYY